MKIINKLGYSLAFIAILLLSTQSYSQNYELGLWGGSTNYQGDLADGIVKLKEGKPSYGLLVRYSPLSYLAFRVGFTAGKIVGDDRTSSRPEIVQRGFSFTSNIRELAVMSEFHLPNYGSSSYGIFRPKFSPFLLCGVGITSLNGEPKAPKDRIPYPFPEFDAKSNFFCVAFGGGFKFQFAQNFATSIEWGTRSVFSDYLDGISQNGNPKANDWYMFGGLTLTYIVDGGDANPYKSHRSNYKKKRKFNF